MMLKRGMIVSMLLGGSLALRPVGLGRSRWRTSRSETDSGTHEHEDLSVHFDHLHIYADELRPTKHYKDMEHKLNRFAALAEERFVWNFM
jgi:hypothetical protein